MTTKRAFNEKALAIEKGIFFTKPLTIQAANFDSYPWELDSRFTKGEFFGVFMIVAPTVGLFDVTLEDVDGNSVTATYQSSALIPITFSRIIAAGTTVTDAITIFGGQ